MATSNTFSVREEVLNVVLADILSERGMLSIPESIRSAIASRNRTLPDVTVADLFGVRIVIEGRIGNTSPVRESLFRDASARVEQGISPICLAVLYPPALRRVTSLRRLRGELASASLMVRVISEGSEGDWAEANVDSLTDILRRSYELLIREDVVAVAVENLEAAIDRASEIIVTAPAAAARLRVCLGIPEETEPQADE